MGKVRILITEDESIIGLDIEAILIKLGYEVIGIASTGDECLNKISDGKPDLILMDIRLQGDKNGIETAEIIHTLYDIPVVFITAYTNDNSLHDAKLAEPYGYIIKPVNEDELRSTVEIALYKSRLDKKLKASDSMLRKAESIARIGTFKYDLKTEKSTWSDEMFKIFDIDPGEFDDSQYLAFKTIHNDDRNRIIETVKTSIEAGNPYDFECRIVHSDGTILNVLAKSEIESDNKGNATFVSGTIQDITEMKRAETRIVHLNSLLNALRNINKLITNEKDTEKLIQTACEKLIEIPDYESVWIALLDENGKYITSSQEGYDEYYKNTVKETLKNDILPSCFKEAMINPGVIIFDNPLESCDSCPISGHYEELKRMLIRLEYNKKTYGILTVRIKQNVFVDDDRSLVRELADDIAFALYSIELEKEREELFEQLIHSEKLSAVGQLAAGVAHEFNNFLNVILGRIQLAIVEDSIDEIKDSLQVIEQVSWRGSDLVKNLSAFAKPRAPKLKIQEITDVIESVIQLQKRQLEIENIKIIREYGDHAKIAFDRGQLEQVFLNLIINATHAIKPLGNGEITISVKEIDSIIEIRFSDTGTGINKDIRAKIFDPFFTTKNADEDKGISGSGLGLSVSFSIIKQHKGIILVESTKGKGTTFILRLPAIKEEEVDAVPSNDALFDSDIDKLKYLRIMIVDDEKEIVNLMQLVFDKAGFKNVIIKDKGHDALSILNEFNPDLVFLDIGMPDMNGEIVFEKIKMIKPYIPIIFMTGKLNIDESRLLKKGAFDLLHKPFEVKKMFEIIKKIGHLRHQ